MTDDARVYKGLGKDFAPHESVNHTAKEYARGDVTTNTVEASFSLLKRGLIGTFHHVGEQHLQRYVTEFDFRWNNRVAPATLLNGIAGKRLTYKQPNGQQ